MSKQDDLLNDFSQFLLNDTSVVDIDLPNGSPMQYQGNPVRVHVYGPSTPQFIRANKVLTEEATKRVVAAMGNMTQKEADERDADARVLVAITATIGNFPCPGGAEAIYREPKLMYIGDQVRKFVGDAANFFGAAATN